MADGPEDFSREGSEVGLTRVDPQDLASAEEMPAGGTAPPAAAAPPELETPAPPEGRAAALTSVGFPSGEGARPGAAAAAATHKVELNGIDDLKALSQPNMLDHLDEAQVKTLGEQLGKFKDDNESNPGNKSTYEPPLNFIQTLIAKAFGFLGAYEGRTLYTHNKEAAGHLSIKIAERNDFLTKERIRAAARKLEAERARARAALAALPDRGRAAPPEEELSEAQQNTARIEAKAWAARRAQADRPRDDLLRGLADPREGLPADRFVWEDPRLAVLERANKAAEEFRAEQRRKAEEEE